MEYILTLLSKPIILTLVTLGVGSYLFARLTERRSKKERTRENALKLLDDVANDLNSVISVIYGHIRRADFKIEKDSVIDKRRAELFTKRFSLRIKSKAFLRSDEFWQRYEQLAFEIDKLVRFMMSLATQQNIEVVAQIKKHQERFAKEWPFKDRLVHSKYPPPSDQLVIWADMVWDRSDWLISKQLNTVLR